MKKIFSYNTGIYAAFFAAALLSVSCTEQIEIGDVDESMYSNVNTVSGYVRDVRTGKSENIIELRADSYSSQLVFGFNKPPKKGVDVVLQYDADYAASYNALHETDFPLYPEELVSIEEDGKILVAPDEKLSYELGLTVTYSDQLKDDQTYILPIQAVSATEGIAIPEPSSRSVYLIRNYRNQSGTYKGEDAVQTFLFYEANDTNPLNTLEFMLEDGTLFFDYIVLFAANINYNAETGRVYVNKNPNIQFLLDNNEQYLQPLRKRGVKVLLGLLGNHDQSGLAQLSEIGAREYARELAALCNAYNLDGVNFDDEYSNSPDLDNPLFDSHGSYAAARLCYETKKAMPDKYVTVYAYGSMYGDYTFDGVEPGQYMDIVVADYGGAAWPVTGMTLKQCSGMSIELNRGSGDSSESTARSRKEQGYGYYMYFALYSGNSWAYQISRIQDTARGLYDMELKTPEYYYEKNSTERKPLTL